MQVCTGDYVNICFLLTHVPDPKTNKRIMVCRQIGQVSVICTRRKNQDLCEPAFSDVPHYVYDYDLPSSKQLVKRWWVSRKYQKTAMAQIRNVNPDIIYADGLDSLIMAAKYKANKKCKVFYDVADLREIYIEKPKNLIKKIAVSLIKNVENRCFRSVDCLVISSPKFFDDYYHNLIDKSKVVFIPNAPEKETFKDYRKKTSGRFTIGFIGGIRYLAQMKMLVDAAEQVDCDVIFSGAGGTLDEYNSILEYCKDKDWVKFTGKYDYNKEIASLYSAVDCIYAVYNADNPNVRIALPNKLYESVICKLPIIVAKNTYLSELVTKWGVGISIAHDNVDDLIENLRMLKNDEDFYNKLSLACTSAQNEFDLEKCNNNLRNMLLS